jgi:flagellar hook-basal body complex protein FliE
VNSINDSILKVSLDKPELTPQLEKAAPAVNADDMSFKDLLKGLVDKVDSLQKDADASIKGLATGGTTDIHNVAIKMEEASVAFDLMMEVRNKLLEAYQEISKMQP